MRLLLVLMFVSCATARSKEDKLVDALIKAQRSVERANAKSEAAGEKLAAYCAESVKVIRVKPNGLMGCVAEAKK